MPINLAHGSGCQPGASPSAHLDLSAQVTAAIDAGLEREALKEPPRRYLGASELGHECLRYLVYRYRGTQEQAPEPRMRRIWNVGHAWDAIIKDWLRTAGFVIRGEQAEFSQAEGRIKGHIDGAIVSGPAALPYPVLLELKALNAKSWQQIAKHGLSPTSKSVYHGQVQLYLGYFDLGAALFGALNKDTEELLWLLIPYDCAAAQRISDRAVDVIRHGDGPLPPRIASERSFFMCRMCGFQGQ